MFSTAIPLNKIVHLVMRSMSNLDSCLKKESQRRNLLDLELDINIDQRVIYQNNII